MVLRFGNVTLLSLEELSGRLFSGQGAKMSIMKDGGRWEEHPLDTTVYGINVEVCSIYKEKKIIHIHELLHTYKLIITIWLHILYIILFMESKPLFLKFT